MRWFVAIFVAMFVLSARAEVAATLPSTQPAAEFTSDSPVRKWFAELGSLDAARREEAQTSLMGLSRDDLPPLRELVAHNLPLGAEQTAALHEIVVHVYLTGEPYTRDNSAGFLGLLWPESGMFDDEAQRLGVPVVHRLPGFPSFQMLRDGDLVLGVFVNPNAPLQQLPNMTTPNRTMLTHVVMEAGANANVVVEVLREGQVIRVPMLLGAKPILPDRSPVEVEAFFAQRLKKGEAYWQREFAPLVLPGMS